MQKITTKSIDKNKKEIGNFEEWRCEFISKEQRNLSNQFWEIDLVNELSTAIQQQALRVNARECFNVGIHK